MHEKATEIVKEINDSFFKDEEETERTKSQIKKILNDFFTCQNLSVTVEDVITFLEMIWKHFSIGKYTKIFVDFAGAEKALYGLRERYRDHLIHIFNVFIMGLLIFSKMLIKDEDIFKLLKIRSEPDKIPFPSRYDEWRRLYYLWCLMSTFHDIATPIEREGELLDSLNRFLGYFRIETERLALKFPFMIQFEASHYSDLMAKLFTNGVVMTDKDELRTYELPNEHTAASLYFLSVLTNAIDNRDHGVLGAYFLFRSIEEIFLSGKHQNLKYDLDVCTVRYEDKLICLQEDKKKWDKLLIEHGISKEKFDDLFRIYDFSRGETKYYNDYVFEQDVTRAALAIALHNLDPINDPKIFPIRFSKLPLSYLLMLLDELQEFYRPEGIVLTEVVRFHGFPQISLNIISPNKNENRIQMTIDFDLKRLKEDEEKLIINRYNNLARSKGNLEVETFEELVRTIWTNIFSTIERKLSFKAEEPLEIFIKVTVEGRDPCDTRLYFRSMNWTDPT